MICGRKLVALCSSKLNDISCFEFVTALGQRLAENEHALFIYNTCTDLYNNTPDESGEKTVFELIDFSITDALVIMDERLKCPSLKHELIEKARAADVPVFVVDGKYEGCINIGFDYRQGFESIVRHVVEFHQIKNVHFMGGLPNHEFSDVRLDCFKRVLAENNIPFDDSMVSYGQYWSGPAKAAAEQLIESGNLPRALICANDIMAITAAAVFTQHGLHIPEDIMVTGFDGIDEIEFSVPKISSCKCGYGDLGAKTADMLSEMFGGKKTASTNITPRLLLSESCGCNYTERINVTEYLNTVNNNFYRYQSADRTLSNISAKMQLSMSTTDAFLHLDNDEMFHNMHCLLNLDAINESINPLTLPELCSFGDKMCVFCDTDHKQGFKPYIFSRSGIIPYLEEYVSLGCPLIFSAINFINIPLGYLCFHFEYYDITNYYKMPQIVTALGSAIGGFRNMRYQQYLNTKLEDMYKLDALTGLYNRRGFMREYERFLRMMPRDSSMTVVLADLDGLKGINDCYGHREGDNAIHTVAQALKFACAEGISTRFGGDEMLSVVMGSVSEADVRAAISEYLDGYNSRSGKPYKVSASVGVYVAHEGDDLDFEEIIKKSDKLMYADKTAKKQAAKNK